MVCDPSVRSACAGAPLGFHPRAVCCGCVLAEVARVGEALSKLTHGLFVHADTIDVRIAMGIDWPDAWKPGQDEWQHTMHQTAPHQGRPFHMPPDVLHALADVLPDLVSFMLVSKANGLSGSNLGLLVLAVSTPLWFINDEPDRQPLSSRSASIDQ